MTPMTLRGLPRGLQRDALWMAADAPDRRWMWFRQGKAAAGWSCLSSAPIYW